jgi:hypothetical protein
MTTSGILVLDDERELRFSFDEMLRYNGRRSPAGVAHAYKVLERVLPLLGGGRPVERREIAIATAFPGPGARDAFELVTRAATEGRYTVDQSLARPENGRCRAGFVFVLRHRDRRATAELRDGFVTEEFITLLALDERSPAQALRFEELKTEMAQRVMAAPAEAVYDAALSSS